MYNLSESQVDIISKKIKEQSIKSFAFSNELLDHVCCRIEQSMENGISFEEALNQTSYLYQRKEIKKIKKNFAIISNYSGLINSIIIYASLLFYLCSWIFHWGQVDWIGFTAFMLISILLLRYTILFYSDRKLRLKRTLVFLSSIGFTFFFVGCINRFLWLNFGFSGTHVMPLMLFSWLVISVTGLFYFKTVFQDKTNSLFFLIAILQVILACLSLSTFIFPFTMRYIPIYATIIIVINITSFLFLYLIKAKGKSFLRLIIVSSSLIVFVYSPHKTIVKNKAQFNTKPKQEIKYSKPHLYSNCYKYDKEKLVFKNKSHENLNLHLGNRRITSSYA